MSEGILLTFPDTMGCSVSPRELMLDCRVRVSTLGGGFKREALGIVGIESLGAGFLREPLESRAES